MERDLGRELTGILRDLPTRVSASAEYGAEPADGLALIVAEDPAWSLRVRPTPHGWAVAEVHRMPPPLGEVSRELASVDAVAASQVIAAEFDRLRLQVRNAACGTPWAPGRG